VLARYRKALEEKREEGFTLIELLVVMIIIGILAAIAIPVFLSQQNKAKDTSVKADVTTIGKDMASYYVDGTADLTVAGGPGGQFTITSKDATPQTITGNLSNGNSVTAKSAGVGSTGAYCAAVTNSGSGTTWHYDSANGLSKGDCP
jgi:prepilin-type N-terminal cleavage/methylation domain-containing protein